MPRIGADALEALALLANHHGLVPVALHHDGGSHAHKALVGLAGLFVELVDDDGGGVGQLVTGEAEELFTHGLTSQEFLAAVGQLVLRVPPGLLGQVFFADAEQALDVALVLGRHGYEFGKRVALLHALEPGGQLGTAVDHVQLVGHQQRGNAGFEQRQHLGIGQGEAACFHHKQDQVHITNRTHHGLVERLVQCRAVLGLKTRRIHEHKLRSPQRADAGDAVARGLRLARGDADLLAHQRIHQRGLAHIGLAHDGNHAAALAFYRHRRVSPRRLDSACRARCRKHRIQIILALSAC